MPTDREGRSPMHCQAFEGSIEDLARTLDEGADPNLADRNGFTPLHFAAQHLDADRVRLLIEHGAEINAQNRFGATPVFVALMNVQDEDHGLPSMRVVPIKTRRGGNLQ